MKLFSRTWYLAALVAGAILTAGFLTVCTDRSTQPAPTEKPQAKQEELQSQLKSEEVRLSEAEQAARAAELSRNTWIVCMGAGACVACVIALFFGIHIGSRAKDRSRKELRHG